VNQAQEKAGASAPASITQSPIFNSRSRAILSSVLARVFTQGEEHLVTIARSHHEVTLRALREVRIPDTRYAHVLQKIRDRFILPIHARLSHWNKVLHVFVKAEFRVPHSSLQLA
jgi:hypothetical protein